MKIYKKEDFNTSQFIIVKESGRNIFRVEICSLKFGVKKMKSLTVALFVACILVVFGEKTRYDKYRVYSIKVENEEQLKVLHELKDARDGISFLETPHSLYQTADIVVPPHKFADISDIIESFEMNSQIRTEDLQK